MQRTRGIIGLAAVGTAVCVAAVAGRRVTRFEIAERSMAPALRPGDYVVAVRPRSGLARGAVVIFPHPDGSGMDLVKRVVAVPGERVDTSGGAVRVDGDVVDEPWADGPTFPDGSWRLGPDEVFVLGDRRRDSAGDSRTIGPVALAAIGWVVVARYRPLRSAGPIGPSRSSR